MKFEEVLPAFKKGKRIKRESVSGWFAPGISEGCELNLKHLLAEDWIVDEPPKLLAPALYYTGTDWILGRTLFESKKGAQEEYGDRQIIWPAIPNKDGYFEVPE